MRKSCTRTVSGWPVGRHVRPAFLKSPTNSFFFVSTEITGWPAAWNWRTCAVMWRNWASRSGWGGPSRVLRLACKLYPAALKSSRTSWWLMRWPMLWRVRARVRVLFAVQRRGESGAPEVVGSTSPSRSRSSVGSLSIVRFRPPPGRRTRPAGMRARDRSSPSPRAIVDVEIPVARATRAMPPRPRARASVAAHTRRDRSVSVDASARYFARQPRRSTHVNLPSAHSDSIIYCLTNPNRTTATSAVKPERVVRAIRTTFDCPTIAVLPVPRVSAQRRYGSKTLALRESPDGPALGRARGPRAVLTRGPDGTRTLGSLLVVECHAEREEGPLPTDLGEPRIDQLARANAGHRHVGRRRDHEPLLILDHDLAARIVDVGHPSQPDLRLIG